MLPESVTLSALATCCCCGHDDAPNALGVFLAACDACFTELADATERRDAQRDAWIELEDALRS